MTRVEPPPGLLDKIAEAQWDWANEHDADAKHVPWSEAQPWDHDWSLGLARAAWDAVADQLQLTEEARYAYKPDCDERRLVSKWEQS